MLTPNAVIPVDILRDDSSSPASTDRNVASHLIEMARRQPEQRALVWRNPRADDYYSWTFAKLNAESDRRAHALLRAGIQRGMRTILMVSPSAEFFAITFALYKIGAVPVLVDPGMGRQSMADCLSAISVQAFVGIPLAQLFRLLNRHKLRSLSVIVTVGPRIGWGGYSLARLLQAAPDETFPAVESSTDEPAAIIFTTGSTGPPKAVLYCHGNFNAQIQILREHYQIQPGEIDLPTFSLFALFDPALGMTAVLPEMDPTRPAHVDPRRIIRAIRDQQVTHMFGSPALLHRVSLFGEQHDAMLPSLRRVISAGAPVPPSVLDRFSKMLSSSATIHTPYGATEALPVTSITSTEILGETARKSASGAGTCVGRPVGGVRVRIIRIVDEPIMEWQDNLQVPDGQIGEIVVSGPVVTREYLTDGHAELPASSGTAATRLAKIRDREIFWHRMGDVGYFDSGGRLWFCGRKSQRVQTHDETLFTDQVEAIFNEHPDVYRSALVGLGPRGSQRPIICIEIKKQTHRSSKDRLRSELAALAAQNRLTQSISTFLFHPRFPVDIRHNAKIFREKLAVWASKQLRIPHHDC